MKINKELASIAKKLDICKPSYEMLNKAESKDAMMQMFVKGIDFCLANDFPSVEYLEKHGEGITEKYGVHVNKTVECINSPFTVLLGESKAVISNNEYSFSQLFIKHQSSVDIELTDNSFTVIDVFDDSVLIGTASGNSRVLINKYGNPSINVQQKDNAQVQIIDKQQKTY